MTPPRPPSVWSRIPRPLQRRALIGVGLVALLLFSLTIPQPGPRSIELAAGPWQGGTLVILLTGARNVSDAFPDSLSYRIYLGGSSYLFEGPEDTQSRQPGVTVTVAYNDLNRDRRISKDDALTITVDPPSYGEIHGRQFSVWHSGTQIGQVTLP